jgi:hypothetical protein
LISYPQLPKLLILINIDLLLKFVKTKITGEATSKLLVRDLTSTWNDVKQILGKKSRSQKNPRLL